MTGASRRYLVIVCRGPECGERRDSAAVHAQFQREVKGLGLERVVELRWQSCFGRCRQGPNVLVRPAPEASAPQGSVRVPLLAAQPARASEGAALYNDVRLEDVARILQSHVSRGMIVRELVLKPEAPVPPRTPDKTHPDGDPDGDGER